MTHRTDWTAEFNQKGFGASYKDRLRKPGSYWVWYIGGFGQGLPQKSNRLYPSKTRKDRFGLPQVVFDMEWGRNEKAIAQDIKGQAERIMKAAGARATIGMGDAENLSTPGAGIHEMGTARMGAGPSQSVLNGYNQAHDIPNLFVTDGSFMASSSCVNPSLTYMAFTARACDYTVKQSQAGSI